MSYINEANTWPKVYEQDGGFNILFRSGSTYRVDAAATADSPIPKRGKVEQPRNVAFNLIFQGEVMPDGKLITAWGQPVRMRDLPVGVQYHLRKLAVDQYKKS